jgi:hypothetical protein
MDQPQVPLSRVSIDSKHTMKHRTLNLWHDNASADRYTFFPHRSQRVEYQTRPSRNAQHTVPVLERSGDPSRLHPRWKPGLVTLMFPARQEFTASDLADAR